MSRMMRSTILLYSNALLIAVATGKRISLNEIGKLCLFTIPRAQQRNCPEAKHVYSCRRIISSSRSAWGETDESKKPIVKGGDSIITVSKSSEKKVIYNKFKPFANFAKVASRHVGRFVGNVFSTVGLLTSVSIAIATDKDHFRRLKPTIKSLQQFFETSGIDVEVRASLNRRLFQNLIILARVQQKSMNGGDRRRFAAYPSEDIPTIPSFEESLRYMKYATAAYGSETIKAAEIDARGIYGSLLYPLSRKQIGAHVGLPEDDVVLSNVAYGTGHGALRHLVAVDHLNRKIILAVRGTFTLSEMVDDLVGFTRPFCGGEAHSEMANKAEKVWEVAGATVLDLLDRYDDYGLVITGHSLGAGAACLLNILCHENEGKLVKGRDVRCFAFSSPPVFAPLEAAPEAVQSTTSFILENDVVPFLSVDSGRLLFSCLQAVQKAIDEMSFLDRLRLVNGYTKPSQALVNAVENAQKEGLPAIPGAPVLMIPATSTVWMRERHRSGKYNVKVCDPNRLALLAPMIHTNMILDHFPPRYEHALHRLNQ